MYSSLLAVALTLTGLYRPSESNIMVNNDGIESPGYRASSGQMTTEETAFLSKTRHPYDKFERPRHMNNENDTSPVHVNVSLDIISLQSVDEASSEYTVNVKMDLEWYDHRIVNTNMNQNELISMPTEHTDRIWCPVMGVPNKKEPGSLDFSGTDTVVALRIRFDGYIYVRTNFQLTLYCLLNFKNYPFDVQKCSIKLESKKLAHRDLVFRWREEIPFKNSDRFQLTGFVLFHHEIFNDSVVAVDHLDGDSISRIGATLHLKREWYHFLLDVYLPSALFVAMSWISFWLEISAAPARVTLGMTTMLTLVTSSMFSRERLPKVSYIHAMDLWIAVCICFIFLSLIEYAFVNYLYRNDKSKRQRLKSLQMEVSTLSLASMATSNISRYLDVPELPRTKISLIIPTLANNLRRLSAESRSTCNLIEPPHCDLDHDHLEHIEANFASVRPKESLCVRLFRCPADELADNIDRKSRLLFPLLFILFNVIYWTTVNL